MTGREMLAEDIADAVERDKIFYKNTGGGVTLSGGEPLAQPIQATSLLSLCKERGISSVVETSGYGNTVDFEAMLEYTDVLLFDIKHMDTEKHKRYTGKDNSLIIKHFLKAANMMHRGKIAGMVLRFPLVPGINDDEENVGETARLAAGAGVKEIHILGFHQAGKAKWRSHGMKYRLEDMRVAGMEEICQSKRIFEAARLNVSIGGGGK
jgi:pyruvate formate lyase activating enzyme